MFNFNGKIGNLEEQATEIMNKSEDLLVTTFKASGCSVMDLLLDLDSESGALIGGAMDLYKDSKKFILSYAGTTDKLVHDLEVLKKMNEALCKQNEQLQGMLQNLTRKVESIGVKD